MCLNSRKNLLVFIVYFVKNYLKLFVYFLEECLGFFGKPKRPRRNEILEFPVAVRDNGLLLKEAR